MEVKNKKKILLVEDDKVLSEMYQNKLSHEGYTVLLARNGTEGLVTAISNRPDLILLDILLPEMDGMTVMKKLRDDPWGKTVPIIILTNLNADDQIVKGVVDNRPAYYLMKSNSDPASVIEKVREVLM